MGGSTAFRRRLQLLAALALAWIAPVSAQAETRGVMISPGTGVEIGTVWGVFIGVSTYQTPELALRFADDDAAALHGFFTTHFDGRIPADQFTLLVNEDVTRANFLRAVGTVLRRAQPEDLIVLFLAMHGILDAGGQDLFFLTHNADPNLPEAQGISRYDLLRQIERSAARKIILLLDACHTGAFAAVPSMLSKRAAVAADVNRLLGAMGQAQDGIAVVSSSSAAEFSEEGPQFCGGHGAFTCGLLTGLQGEADANRNGLIELRELFDHTYRAVKTGTGNNQHPSIEGRYDNSLPLASAPTRSHGSTPPVVNMEPYRELERESEYFSRLEQAWTSVKGYADTESVPRESRLAALGRFLRDFHRSNPHQQEAEALARALEGEKEEAQPDEAPSDPPIEEARARPYQSPADLGAPVGEPQVGSSMVSLPSGAFEMGAAPEEECDYEQIFGVMVESCAPDPDADYAPPHRVSVDTFDLDIHEVTNEEFVRFVEATSYVTTAAHQGVQSALAETDRFLFGTQWAVERVDGATWRHPHGPQGRIGPELATHPVVQVSWHDAWAYCRWAGKRLPTEAEWEYAARAGTGSRHWWGDGRPRARPVGNLPDDDLERAYDVEPAFEGYSDGHARTAPVGSFEPNPWGLHDMAGNVWEWTADWYAADYYARSPGADPQGPDTGEQKIKRGGSWLSYSALTTREKQAPHDSDDRTGFRCARDAATAPP